MMPFESQGVLPLDHALIGVSACDALHGMRGGDASGAIRTRRDHGRAGL
jgi:hypothetical protein